MLKGNRRCTGYRAIEDAIRGVKNVEEISRAYPAGPAWGPAAEAIVTGQVRYTLDTEVAGLLHLKLLRITARPRPRCVDT